MALSEHRRTFRCFGSECTVIIEGERDAAGAAAAVMLAKRRLLEWHARFSRFEPDSELSRLNADERTIVPISPLMGRLIAAILRAAELTGGLVDATLVTEIEHAGYGTDFTSPSVPLESALAQAPERRPAGPRRPALWSGVCVDRKAGTVRRARGVRFDSGGLAKGVFADELGSLLGSNGAFAVDCAGDILLGGARPGLRNVHVESPFDGSTLHTFPLSRGAVATSGIGRRSWIDVDGSPAHHLLDPRTGRPAFTGIVQVTALAPNGTVAEIHSKAALLSGPAQARRWLPHGGLIVYDDGSHRVITPAHVAGRRSTCTGREARPAARAR